MKSLLFLIEQSFCPDSAQTLDLAKNDGTPARLFMMAAPIATIHIPVNEVDPTSEKEILKV
jgi:hypothetical protein